MDMNDRTRWVQVRRLSRSSDVESDVRTDRNAPCRVGLVSHIINVVVCYDLVERMHPCSDETAE